MFFLTFVDDQFILGVEAIFNKVATEKDIDTVGPDGQHFAAPTTQLPDEEQVEVAVAGKRKQESTPIVGRNVIKKVKGHGICKGEVISR